MYHMRMVSLQYVFLVVGFKLLIIEKALPNVSNAYGFSPVCVLRCWLRLLILGIALPYVSHAVGFSLVCVLRC